MSILIMYKLSRMLIKITMYNNINFTSTIANYKKKKVKITIYNHLQELKIVQHSFWCNIYSSFVC